MQPARTHVEATRDEQMETRSSGDRDLQDEVIRYLTEAKVRSAHKNLEFLDWDNSERARRFSRFLARRYYRDRLHRGFRHASSQVSEALAAEHVVDSPGFNSILDNCILGSFATSREVGQLAIGQLSPLRSESWWCELLEYELAFFIQLATSENSVSGAFPKKNPLAIVRKFQFRVPEILARLRVGKSLADDYLRSEETLLFSRTNHGRIYVMELDTSALAVFSAVDGSTPDQIAKRCAASSDEIRRVLATFQDIGAVVPPMA